MQSKVEEEKLSPDRISDSETKLSQEFSKVLSFTNGFFEKKENEAANNSGDIDDEGGGGEGEFSFFCGGSNSSPIAAEDAFSNGLIKPVFPFLTRDYAVSAEDLPIQPPVKKVFVETEEVNREATSTDQGNEIMGPYCDWSNRKAVEVSAREVCKKSNSTGFSKIWRFKELLGRSNSDGKDTFVFLNNNAHAPPPGEKAETARVEKKAEAAPAKVSGSKGKKTSKSKTTTLSPHEAYLKSKAKGEGGRRRSYLPYRPELMGFFTNVNSGLSKNVHPY